MKVKFDSENFEVFKKFMNFCKKYCKEKEFLELKHRLGHFSIKAGVFLQKVGKEKFIIYTEGTILLREKIEFKSKGLKEFQFIPYLKLQENKIIYLKEIVKDIIVIKCKYNDIISLPIYYPHFSQILDIKYDFPEFFEDITYYTHSVKINNLDFDTLKINLAKKFFGKNLMYFSTKGKKDPIYFCNQDYSKEVWLMPKIYSEED